MLSYYIRPAYIIKGIARRITAALVPTQERAYSEACCTTSGYSHVVETDDGQTVAFRRTDGTLQFVW